MGGGGMKAAAAATSSGHGRSGGNSTADRAGLVEGDTFQWHSQVMVLWMGVLQRGRARRAAHGAREEERRAACKAGGQNKHGRKTRLSPVPLPLLRHLNKLPKAPNQIY